MFLWSTAGDIRLAYTAAAQTVNEYRITNRLSLFTVAKIIAFDIATLSSLSLSMYEDVSMLLALRLRGNANSLDRSGERSRRGWNRKAAPAPAQAEDSVEAAIAEAEQMVREAKARMQAAAPARRGPAGRRHGSSGQTAAPPAPSPDRRLLPPPNARTRRVSPSPPGRSRQAVARALTAESRACRRTSGGGTWPRPSPPPMPRRRAADPRDGRGVIPVSVRISATAMLAGKQVVAPPTPAICPAGAHRHASWKETQRLAGFHATLRWET